MDRLAGKTALVTGAARGIGRATAELFATEGAQVVAADLLEPDPYAGDVEFVRLDVADEAQWAGVGSMLEERFGRLDVLVNNAGIIAYENVEELTLDGWQRSVGANQTGVWLGMRTAVPLMRAAGEGSIVNVSSIWGTAAVAGAHAYHATKGAVRTMSKNAAITYAPEGIRVNSLHPGFIATPLTEAQDESINTAVIAATPMGRAGQPFEVAQAALFLASSEASFVTGAELVVDGGYLAQ